METIKLGNYPVKSSVRLRQSVRFTGGGYRPGQINDPGGRSRPGRIRYRSAHRAGHFRRMRRRLVLAGAAAFLVADLSSVTLR